MKDEDQLLKNYLLDRKPGRGKVVEHRARTNSNKNRTIENYTEISLIQMIDMKRKFDQIGPILDKLNKGQLDVSGMFGAVSSKAAVELLRIALAGETEKNRLDAVKHLLALGGYSPAQKHEIARVDPSTPKEAILSLLAGMKGELEPEGLDIIDDRENDSDPKAE